MARRQFDKEVQRVSPSLFFDNFPFSARFGGQYQARACSARNPIAAIIACHFERLTAAFQSTRIQAFLCEMLTSFFPFLLLSLSICLEAVASCAWRALEEVEHFRVLCLRQLPCEQSEQHPAHAFSLADRPPLLILCRNHRQAFEVDPTRLSLKANGCCS